MVPTFMDIQCSILDVRRYLWLFMEVNVQCLMFNVRCSVSLGSGWDLMGELRLKGEMLPDGLPGQTTVRTSSRLQTN